MSPVVSRWNRFWFQEVDGAPLGLVRITFALAGLLAAVEMAPLLPRHYTDTGVLPLSQAREWGVHGPLSHLLLWPEVLGSSGAAVALHLLLVTSLLALLVGFRTRVAAWATFLLIVWFQSRNPTLLHGGDEVLRLTALYLAVGHLPLSPGQRAFSLDRRRAIGSSASNPRDAEAALIPAWPLRLIQIQVALMYLTSGIFKLGSEPWWDGTALALSLGNPLLTRFGLPDWPWLQIPFLVLGVAVVLWQLFFWLLVLRPRGRTMALLFGVAFHLGIAVGMNLGTFPLTVLAIYPVFLSGATVRRGLGLVSRGTEAREVLPLTSVHRPA